MYPVTQNYKNSYRPSDIAWNRPAFTSQKQTLNVDKVEKINNISPNEKPTKMLLSLLKSSLMGGNVDTEAFKGANRYDWEKLLEIANEASVTAIASDSCYKLPKGTIPTDIAIQMFEVRKETEQKHELQEKILDTLSKKFEKENIETVQLKGVGLSMNYPVPQHRFGGDIDVFTRIKGTVTQNRSNASDIIDNMMVSEGYSIDDYKMPKIKHSEFEYNGVRIENHRYFVNKEILLEAGKIDEYLHKTLNPRQQILPNGTKILVPSKEFNTVFLAQHAFQHYVFGGIDLHHLTDWGMHIKENGLNFPKELNGTKLEEFTYAFTNLSNKYLGTKIDVPANKEYEADIFKTILNPASDAMPEGLSNIEVLAFKFNRFMKKAKRAEKFGGHNAISALARNIALKLKDPSKLLVRI